MRRSLSAVLGLLCATVLMPQVVHATGNVLLPSDNSTPSSSLPNLGIGPSPSTPAGSSAPTPVGSTQPSLPGTNTGQAKRTPVPTLPASGAHPAGLVMIGTTANLPRGAVPTIIHYEDDRTKILDQARKNLPHALTIAMSSRSLFSGKDVQEISSKLNLTRDQIASSCFLSVEGVMRTDKDTYIISTGSAPPPLTVRYDGMIQSYTLEASALCQADDRKLPPHAGIIYKTNDRFNMLLGLIQCDVPRSQVSSLTITYDGTGKSQCVYN